MKNREISKLKAENAKLRIRPANTGSTWETGRKWPMLVGKGSTL